MAIRSRSGLSSLNLEPPLADALYRVCAPVLIVTAGLHAVRDLPFPDELRQRMLELLDRATKQATQLGVADADIHEARYALVAFIDEQIARSNWSGRNEWLNNPLQLLLYRENTAGENFFVRLKRLLSAARPSPSLEVYYLCLCLGFRGSLADREQMIAPILESTRSKLLSALPAPEPISVHAEPKDRGRFTGINRTPLLGLALGCVLAAAFLVGGLRWMLHSSISDAREQISTAAQNPTQSEHGVQPRFGKQR